MKNNKLPKEWATISVKEGHIRVTTAEGSTLKGVAWVRVFDPPENDIPYVIVKMYVRRPLSSPF